MKSLILSTALILSASLNAQILDNVWELSEINNPSQTDAYPYITDDGLRLYFTSNDGLYNNIYYSSRPDLDTDFAPKQLLDSVMFAGTLSSWFTLDELEVYYSNGSSLFHASRPTTSSPFESPTEITLIGGNTSFIAAPSLTQNGDELYIYNGAELMEYEYTNDSTYNYVSEVLPPMGFIGGMGQLSIDGLTLHWSLKPALSDTNSIYIAERTSIGDDFSNPVLMNSFINTPVLINSQASFAATANVLVWVRNNQPIWQENQLYIAQASEANVDELTNSGPKELVKIVDLLGRETADVPGVVLIYVYSDGSTERRFTMK